MKCFFPIKPALCGDGTSKNREHLGWIEQPGERAGQRPLLGDSMKARKRLGWKARASFDQRVERIVKSDPERALQEKATAKREAIYLRRSA